MSVNHPSRSQRDFGGDRWEVVELRALDADGRALWLQKYDEAALARIKANTSSLDWAALYDQAPHPEDGEYFRAEWIVPVDIIPHPSQLRFYGGSDFAVSAGKNDYTVHVVVALDSKLRLYLVDMWRKQATSAEWVEAFCDMVKRWRPALWALEKGQITSGVGPFLRARMRERRAHTGLEEFPVGRRDKAQRAQPIRGWMELRSGLHVPAKASWLSDLKSELLAFPNGRNDDIVDALGLGGQLIDKWAPGGVPKIEPDGFRPLNDYIEPYRRDEPLLSLKVL